MAKINPFPEPKRGRARQVAKRSATKKTAQWKAISDSPKDAAAQPQGLRQAQRQWKRKLVDLLAANDSTIIKLLRTDSLLPCWEGKTCPRCGKSKVSKLETSA